jgi:hypothetical protein
MVHGRVQPGSRLRMPFYHGQPIPIEVDGLRFIARVVQIKRGHARLTYYSLPHAKPQFHGEAWLRPPGWLEIVSHNSLDT